MMEKTFIKRALTSALGVILALCIGLSSSIGVVAESPDSLRKKIEDAKAKASDLADKKEAANETYQAKLEVYYAASDAVDDINNQITALEAKIVKTENSIKKLKVEIKKQEEAIKKRYNEFKARLKSLYIAGSLTSMQVLLTAEDFSDYLTKLELVRQVGERDNAAIAEMERLAAQLEKDKQKLDENKQKLEEQEADLKEDRIALQEAEQEAEKAKDESLQILQKIKSQQKNNNAMLHEYQEELNDVLEQIRKAEEEAKRRAAMQQQQQGGGNSTPANYPIVQGTGQFCYPVPGHTSISCGFYGYWNHNGVDFSDGSINGATVVAADAGTVIKVSYLTYSYGQHIFIYHGNGLTTQYCHLSAIYVSEGQTVTQGQSIGAVGSTGNSTGPHLHFGVFDSSGAFLNPEGYF